MSESSIPLPEADALVIRLSGEFDIARERELEQLLAEGYSAKIVELDMREVPYIDSTAIACIIRLKKRMLQHGPGVVRIVRPQPNVRKILELTKLDQVFDIVG